MLTVSWISNLINDTVLYFLNIILIKKIISLFKNLFIFFITVKMLLINFMSQILLLLNLISIFVQFLTANTTTPAQILPKPCPDSASIKTLTKFLWNLNKVSVASTRNHLNKILLRLILSSSNFASFNFALSSLTLFSCLFNSQIFNCASSC